METRKISVGKHQIQLLDAGQGSTVLLVHGFPLDHSMWRFQVNELAEHYRVLCPDLPGYGSSSHVVESLSLADLADILAEMLTVLGVAGSVTYCGLSMGGYIGWQFVHRYPDRVSHLIACDTRAANDSETVSRARRVAAATVRQTGSSPVADAMILKLFCPHSISTRPEIVEQTHAVIAQTDPATIANGQLAMSDRPDATKWLEQINVPSLFVVGQEDEITPPSEMRQNAELIANAEFLEITDAGHMAPLENPAIFNREILEFLRRTTVVS